MTDKDYVAQEMHACPACGKQHAVGVLLHKKLRKTLPPQVTTGWSLCPDDQEKIDEGYIVMVGVDEHKSERMPNGNIGPSGAWRTGDIAYVKAAAFANIFDIPAPQDGFCYTDPQVIRFLESAASKEDDQ